MTKNAKQESHFLQCNIKIKNMKHSLYRYWQLHNEKSLFLYSNSSDASVLDKYRYAKPKIFHNCWHLFSVVSHSPEWISQESRGKDWDTRKRGS